MMVSSTHPKFQIEWLYSDLKDGQTPADSQHFAIHFVFLIRFPDIPPGPDHVAHFCFNVLSPAAAQERGLVDGTANRGYLIKDPFSYSQITEEVDGTVLSAFINRNREQALEFLNTQYIYTDLDFSNAFRADVLDATTILEMIQRAFNGVERGLGITLHEAVVLDDYGSQAEQEAARAIDSEQRWQDVPEADIRNNPHYLTFLDIAGYRYYLPANMSWVLALETVDLYDCGFYTYRSLLPTVAPRDVGQGKGAAFDVQRLITQCSFSAEQVKAIYHFLCFMAIEQGLGVKEDDYPAMLQWKNAALST